MGARGIKRRRKDGSIATGRIPVPSAGFEKLEAVPAEVLAQAVTIINRAGPIDPVAYANTRDQDQDGFLDEAEMEASEEIDRLADVHSVDALSLDIRAGKLIDLLREASPTDLYMIGEDGSVVIKRDLLEYAATVPTTPGREKFRLPQ